MTEPIQPAGASPAGKPQNQDRSEEADGEKKLSFQDVLKKAQKAIDKGEKASDFIDRVNAGDRTQLEKVLSQNQELENIFEDLFRMIERLKQKESQMNDASFPNTEAEND